MDPLIRLPKGFTSINARYGPCVNVHTLSEADELLLKLVREHARAERVHPQIAREIERANIGYFAGGFLPWWESVEIFHLFHTQSPIFGTAYPEIHEAFWAGVRIAVEQRGLLMHPEEIQEMLRWTDHLPRWKTERARPGGTGRTR